MQGKNKKTKRNNQIFMLLFAGCNDDHILQCKDQRHKYADVKHGKYAGDGMYVAKGKYSEYAKDSVDIAKGEYGEHTKEAAFIEEGDNKLLATRAMAAYVVQGNNKPLTTRAIGHVHHVRQKQAPRQNGWLGHNLWES